MSHKARDVKFCMATDQTYLIIQYEVLHVNKHKYGKGTEVRQIQHSCNMH